MDTIYAVRDRRIIRYDVIKSDENTYSLRDTSCSDHDNCEIRIARNKLDTSGRYDARKNVEFLNDSAIRYDYFHIGLKFFLSEKDAMIEVENEYIEACKESLDLEIDKRDRVKQAIADLTDYLNTTPECTENSVIGYGSHICTYSAVKLHKEACKVYHGQTLSVEETLRTVIYDLTINEVSEIIRTKNGITTKRIEMFIDNRSDEDSLDEHEIYLRVKVTDGKIEVSPVSFYDDDSEIEYCKGIGLSSEGYKDLYECKKFIINEMINRYNSRLTSILKNITEYETFLDNHITKRKCINEL